MLSHLAAGITLTMTTCKRLDMFIRTVDAFFTNCTDSHLIRRVIVSDDRSSHEDRLCMVQRYPSFEYYFNDGGQPQALNFLFNNVKTEYTFHLEDDRLLVRKLDLLTTSLKVLEEGGVESFISACHIGSKTGRVQSLRYNNWSYYVHEHVPDHKFWSDWELGNKSWPGFYLAAGLHRSAALQSIPYMPDPQHERSYATKYWHAGYKVAFNCGPGLFEHIGKDRSSYDMTHAPR